jgi:NAD(P)-dependent dehydrogenase (short-subunit alcohol dehydrogenase family)
MTAVPAALAALTKGGLNAVTRSLALEYANKGIRVNAVSPGIIKTPMHSAESYEFLATLHPMARMDTVEEVVDAVLYLETARFVTGEILHVRRWISCRPLVTHCFRSSNQRRPRLFHPPT